MTQQRRHDVIKESRVSVVARQSLQNLNELWLSRHDGTDDVITFRCVSFKHTPDVRQRALVVLYGSDEDFCYDVWMHPLDERQE